MLADAQLRSSPVIRTKAKDRGAAPDLTATHKPAKAGAKKRSASTSNRAARSFITSSEIMLPDVLRATATGTTGTTMSKSPYKQRRPGTLKAAVADLIEQCGGYPRAAMVARVSRSQLFRYSNDSEEDVNSHMPADIVAALERYCGSPVVTEWLAVEANCTLLPIAIDPEAEAIPKNVGQIAQHASSLFAEFATAFGDGRIDELEAGRMLEAGDAMLREYMNLRPALTGRTRA
ncbi:phage regulatory CII family protein [Azospirillum agricola]|uniref:phage regulatory CII family protein n=1 Tax=Azospirillum agricola TaxID=1720247 RepID=UPI000A0F2D61|nr:phage regulatory CII family protein [Azospirillum agricola]SMH62569.1 hypothetical protein SAMN02982994_6372 [Azospirillum lipoferum]